MTDLIFTNKQHRISFDIIAVKSCTLRLLSIYHRRLRSNLVHALRPRAGAEARRLAETLGALIDGVYLRAVIDQRGPQPARAHEMVRRWLDDALRDS